MPNKDAQKTIPRIFYIDLQKISTAHLDKIYQMRGVSVGCGYTNWYIKEIMHEIGFVGYRRYEKIKYGLK